VQLFGKYIRSRRRRGLLVDEFELPSGAKLYLPAVPAWEGHARRMEIAEAQAQREIGRFAGE